MMALSFTSVRSAAAMSGRRKRLFQSDPGHVHRLFSDCKELYVSCSNPYV